MKSNYGGDLERELARSARPVPLSQMRIQMTVQRARVDITRMRRRGSMARTFAAAAFLVLASAGSWHWSGSHSADLDMQSTIRVLQSPRMYTEENTLAAIGMFDREAVRELRMRKPIEGFSAGFRQAISKIIDGDGSGSPHGRGGKLEGARPSHLGMQESELLAVIGAGISAVRVSGERSHIARTYASICCQGILAAARAE